MDAVSLLLQDHRKVEKLYSDFQSALAERREQLARELQTQLLAHMDAEEDIFYPALVAVAKAQVEHAIEEHAKVRAAIDELSLPDSDEEATVKHFAAIMKRVEQHIREEEAPGGLMELARLHLSGDELTEIAGYIQRVRLKIVGEEAA